MRLSLHLALIAVTALAPQIAAAAPKYAVQLGPVATHAAQAVKAKLPPAATVVAVRPIGRPVKGDSFGPLLERALRDTGFAVASDPTAQGVQPVSYDVARVGGDVILRLEVAGEQSARLLRTTDNGAVALAGPVTVKETD